MNAINSVSNATLARIAAIGSVVVCGTGFLINRSYQNRLKETKNFKKAMEIFYDHPKAANYLGRPISVGNVDVDDGDTDVVPFTVALKGSNTNGVLYCEVKRSYDPAIIPELKKVEIKFKDIPDKSFVIMDSW